MDATTIIKEFTELIENKYYEKLLDAKTRTKGYMGIHFSSLIQQNPSLAEELLDNPEETLDSFKIACRNKNSSLTKSFEVRIKNAARHSAIPINKIRTKHLGKFITAEGIIKRKSEVRPVVVLAKFECPTCGNVMNILQFDDTKFAEPTRCGCGRKGSFRLLGTEKIDVFSMTLEEPTEMISGGTKLSQVRVLCKADLTNPVVERGLYQGVRTRVTGILTEFQINSARGKKTCKVDWYINANYIKVFDETFLNIKWDKKDLEKFEELSKRKNWLADLRKSIFFDVHGYEEECEGIILQMFSGVGKTRDGIKIRGNFHILLIGDPGTAKSTFLKITQQFAPKSQYVAGAGVSGVGLTASVARDELLGGFTLEAGALVLCNNGILMIDELDKIGDENKRALHEPLENETVSISKANIQATLIAQTSVLAAANPKHGTYSEYDSIYSQLDLEPTLVNRFDLVYPIKESKLTSKDDYEIALKILSRGTKDEVNPEFDREFIKKYIAYARTITPVMPNKIRLFIAEKYRHLKDLKRSSNVSGQDCIPVTGRNVDGFRRIIEAVAKSRLHEVITEDDALIGYGKVIYSIQQVGIDPGTGEAIVEETFDGKAIKEKDLAARILRVLREMTKKTRTPMNGDELYSILESDGIKDEHKIDEIISKLKRTGDIIEPRPNKYIIGG